MKSRGADGGEVDREEVDEDMDEVEDHHEKVRGAQRKGGCYRYRRHRYFHQRQQ